MKTSICGIPLENPFILASAPPTASISMIERAFSLGWAGAITKTIKPDSMIVENAKPRFNTLKEGQKIFAFQNFELVSQKELNYWKNGISFLKKKFPNKVVFASIMGDQNEQSWTTLAKELELSGADGLELNFSCPHGMPEMGGGAAIGQNPPYVKKITAWVKSSVSIPVLVKITPNVNSVLDQGQAALEGGADGLAAINTIKALCGVDLDNLTPLPNVNGATTFGGLSGKAVKPIGLRVICELAQNFTLPLSGMGGISTWKDAAEYIALGASSVQICTEVMLKGFDIITELLAGLSTYLESRSYIDLEQLIGRATPLVTSHNNLEKKQDVVASVTLDKCINCRRCKVACLDGGFQAISFEGGEIKIDTTKCDGCSLCAHVCPTQAINIS